MYTVYTRGSGKGGETVQMERLGKQPPLPTLAGAKEYTEGLFRESARRAPIGYTGELFWKVVNEGNKPGNQEVHDLMTEYGYTGYSLYGEIFRSGA